MRIAGNIAHSLTFFPKGIKLLTKRIGEDPQWVGWEEAAMEIEQAELQALCREIVEDTAAVLGCSLVDIQTGLPLATEVRPSPVLNAAAMELISVAAANYFGDRTAGGAHPGSAAKDSFREVQTTTEDAYFYMSVVPGREWELLTLVVDRKSASLGLGWMLMRLALERLQVSDEAEAVMEPHAGQPANPLANVAQPLASQPRSRAPSASHRRRSAIWGQR